MAFPIALGLIKMIPWVVGGIAGMYATKKVTEAFGSTPANDLKQIPQLERMSPKEIYQDRKEWRRDRVKYHENKGKEIQDEIDKLNKKIELENEEKQKILKKLEGTEDPTEKVRLKQKLAAIDKNLSEFQKQLNSKEKEKKESEQKIDEVFNKFDDNLTQEQFIEKSNSINWGSYKNYGIILACAVVFFMLIGFFRKALAGIAGSFKG